MEVEIEEVFLVLNQTMFDGKIDVVDRGGIQGFISNDLLLLGLVFGVFLQSLVFLGIREVQELVLVLGLSNQRGNLHLRLLVRGISDLHVPRPVVNNHHLFIHVLGKYNNQELLLNF